MEGLTKEQQQEYNKYKKIDKYFFDNAIKVNTYIPLKDEVAEFKLNIKAVEDTAPTKTVSNTGITEDKDDKKEKVAKHWARICSKTLAFAKKQKDLVLQEKVKFTKSDFIEMADGEVWSTCDALNKLITPLLANVLFTPYNIVAADLTTGMTLAGEFKDMIGAFDDAESGKTVASLSLDEIYKKLHENNAQFKLLMTEFRESDVDFYNGYVAVDVEDDIGVRNTGIKGVLINKADGSPLVGIVKNKGNGKTAKANLVGEYDNRKYRGGYHEFEATAPGKKTITKVIKVPQGQMVDVNWEFEDL